jgi:hypothetical protein
MYNHDYAETWVVQVGVSSREVQREVFHKTEPQKDWLHRTHTSRVERLISHLDCRALPVNEVALARPVAASVHALVFTVSTT